jgi:hypothetical protein
MSRLPRSAAGDRAAPKTTARTRRGGPRLNASTSAPCRGRDCMRVPRFSGLRDRDLVVDAVEVGVGGLRRGLLPEAYPSMAREVVVVRVSGCRRARRTGGRTTCASAARKVNCDVQARDARRSAGRIPNQRHTARRRARCGVRGSRDRPVAASPEGIGQDDHAVVAPSLVLETKIAADGRSEPQRAEEIPTTRSTRGSAPAPHDP